GWGIRTLSDRHPAYNPFTYHLGSVWPAANAIIAFGFKRYGFNLELHRLAKAIFDASELFDLDRLPEVIGGHARDGGHPHPGIYPDANSPQAWSASAVVLLVHAMLGLTPVAPRELLIVDPDLPAATVLGRLPLPMRILIDVQVQDVAVAVIARPSARLRLANLAAACSVLRITLRAEARRIRLGHSALAEAGSARVHCR